MRKTIIPLVTAVAVLATGCCDADMEYFINDDGSVSAESTVLFDKVMYDDLMSSSSEDNPVADFQIVKRDGKEYYCIKSSNMVTCDDLSVNGSIVTPKSFYMENTPFLKKGSGKNATVQLNPSVLDLSGVSWTSAGVDLSDPKVLADMVRIEFKVGFGEDPIDTNGVYDGNSVTWVNPCETMYAYCANSKHSLTGDAKLVKNSGNTTGSAVTITNPSDTTNSSDSKPSNKTSKAESSKKPYLNVKTGKSYKAPKTIVSSSNNLLLNSKIVNTKLIKKGKNAGKYKYTIKKVGKYSVKAGKGSKSLKATIQITK